MVGLLDIRSWFLNIAHDGVNHTFGITFTITTRVEKVNKIVSLKFSSWK